jgi:hypothetical protein
MIDGKSVDRGIASRMLFHANALVARAYEVNHDVDGEPILDSFGLPTLITDADGQPVVHDSTALGRLTKYVGLLDAARQIGHELGNGPISGSEGD